MDSHTNIDLKKLLASAALEDEELAEKLDRKGADKFTFQKIEWKADEEAGGFERKLVGIYVEKKPFISCTARHHESDHFLISRRENEIKRSGQALQNVLVRSI
jgi:hypothetical protein